MPTAIFQIRCEVDDETRPYCQAVPRDRNPGWGPESNLRVLNPRPGDPFRDLQEWAPWDLVCEEPGLAGATDWDFYDAGNSSGLFSERAVDVLRPSFGEQLEPLPCTFEGQPYYCLAVRNWIDCLDLGACDLEYYVPRFDRGAWQPFDRDTWKVGRVETEPYVGRADAKELPFAPFHGSAVAPYNGICWISRHVFHHDRLTDPQMFAIPYRLTCLYVTESVPEIVRRHGLKGFEFVLVDDGYGRVVRDRYS